MQVILYNNSSEKIRVDKSDYLNAIATLDGTLRVATSLINPIITFELESVKLVVDSNEVITQDSNDVNVTIDILSRIIGCNYAQIPIFNRYYYVTDLISLNSKLWQLTMSVDALMSFKDNIYNLNAFVSRNEYNYDSNIPDSLILSTNLFETSILSVDDYEISGSKKNVAFNYSLTYHIICSCLSTSVLQGYSNIIAPYDNLPSIYSNTMTGGYCSTIYALNATDLYNVTYTVSKDISKASYVKSLIIYPFEVSRYAESKDFLLGDKEVYISQTETKASAYQSLYIYDNYKILNDFKITIDESFLNLDPYTQYELYIPFVGWITFESTWLNKHLILYYSVSYEDGTASVNLYNVDESCMVYSTGVQIGIRIGVSGDNAVQLEAQKKSNELNMYLSLLGSAISVGVGAYSGNAMAVASGVITGAKAIANKYNAESTMFPHANVNPSSGGVGYNSPLKAQIRVTKKNMYYPDGFETLYGKPLNKYLELSTLKGYTVVGEVHVHDIPNATNQEIESIESLLKQGVIL